MLLSKCYTVGAENKDNEGNYAKEQDVAATQKSHARKCIAFAISIK